MDMLEADDYNNIDMVSSFAGAIDYRFSGLDHVPIT